MKDNWVDFKAIKLAVTMQMILDRYGINWLRMNGEELRGRCPIHQGEGQSTFHAHLTKNVFNCFSCKARGNVLDFVAAMEKCSVRDAGVKLKEWFAISDEPSAAEPKTKPADNGRGLGDGEAAGNKPLNFQLKSVDSSHPYLAERGISKETAEAFGVGFYSGKGSMNGRVVIPIHNEHGELVAYAGRTIDGSEPKYKLPAGFKKSHVLYNLYRVDTPTVIVVEGFFDCLKVSQVVHPFVVALMGCTLSREQERLILDRFAKVTLCLDADEPGRRAADEIATRLVHHLNVRIIDLPWGSQPDQLTAGELGSHFSSL